MEKKQQEMFEGEKEMMLKAFRGGGKCGSLCIIGRHAGKY